MNRRLFLQSLAALGLLPSVPTSLLRSTTYSVPSDVEKSLQHLVEAAMANGARYADARFVHQRIQSLGVRRDHLAQAIDNEIAGIALRVYQDGNWGFATTSNLKDLNPKTLASAASGIAKALAQLQTIPFIEEGRIRGQEIQWQSEFKTDPFTVPLKERIDFLVHLSTKYLNVPLIAYSVANLFATKRTVQFYSSLNTSVEQTFVATYPNFGITAFDQTKGRIDSRSSSLEPSAVGYEITTRHPFESEMEEAFVQLLEFNKAESLPTGEYDLVMTPSHFWRVLYETLLPHIDTNTITGIDGQNPEYKLFSTSDIGKKVIDSTLWNMMFDNTFAEGLGSYRVDDSAREAGSGSLLDQGRLAALILSDEFADSPITAFSTRASTWQSVPRFTMPNIILKPSEASTTVNDLIGKTERGILLDGRGTVSLSTNRKWFRANSQIAWLIENGQKKHMVRDFEYDTSLQYFLAMLSDLGGKESMFSGGDFFPQNKNPLWELPFTVVVPPARFSKINVISTKR